MVNGPFTAVPLGFWRVYVATDSDQSAPASRGAIPLFGRGLRYHGILQPLVAREGGACL